jgi:hypothetical protein
MLEIQYEYCLDKLLLPVVEDAKECERLKEDAKDPLWQKLRVKLCEQHSTGVTTACQETIVDIEGTLDRLKDELGNHNPDLRPEWPFSSAPRARISHEVDRLKFSLGQKQLHKMLSEIESLVDSLERVLKMSDEDMTLQQSTGIKLNTRTDSALVRFWRRANAIHGMLSSVWVCACRPYHQGTATPVPILGRGVHDHYVPCSPAEAGTQYSLDMSRGENRTGRSC